MLPQCALVVLKLPTSKKQLLPLHRDLRSLADSDADLMDRVNSDVGTDCRLNCSVRRSDGYWHAGSRGLSDHNAERFVTCTVLMIVIVYDNSLLIILCLIRVRGARHENNLDRRLDPMRG